MKRLPPSHALLLALFALVGFACFHSSGATSREQARPTPSPEDAWNEMMAAATDAGIFVEVTEASSDDVADAGEDETGEGEDGEPAERAITDLDAGTIVQLEYSDEELARLWKENPQRLGPIAVGFVDRGRLINGIQMPQSPDWHVVAPENSWGTQETINSVIRVIQAMKARYPDIPRLRVNEISAREGGYLKPHHTHQNGRDVDLAFYYPTDDPIRVRERERVIDVEKNWWLVKTLITECDVQFILVDRRVQKVLYKYALSHGEDKAWLDSLFFGRNAALMHARKHRDHFHVRFFNPRAQELGRRIAPLLAARPEQNFAMHQIQKGESLSRIARHYGSSVGGIRKANKLGRAPLKVGTVLKVPLRGPCTRCPVPPPLILPPRRLPPAASHASASLSPPKK